MPSINIGSFNIFLSRAPEAVRDLIKQYDLAIVGLQEVYINGVRSRRLNVPQVVADGKHSVFCQSVLFGRSDPPTMPPQNADTDEQYGIAFVSALPIKKHVTAVLGPTLDVFWHDPENAEKEPRSALAAQIDIFGQPVWIINTHLSYTVDRSQPSSYRQAQIGRLLSFVKTCVPLDAPVILMGDFNAIPENPDLEKISEVFQRIPMDELTYPVSETKPLAWHIDHFFCRNLEKYGFSYGTVRTHADPAISDHKLCMLTLTR